MMINLYFYLCEKPGALVFLALFWCLGQGSIFFKSVHFCPNLRFWGYIFFPICLPANFEETWFLQPLHPVLDLQVERRLMKRIPRSKMICHAKKILGLTPQASLACSEPKLQFHSLKSYLASYSTSIQFLISRSILG